MKIILKYIIDPVLHLFSGSSKIGDIRVDINPEANATIINNVFTYIENCNFEFNTLLMDPIYSNEKREELWRDKYSKYVEDKNTLFIFPYDTRRTKKLWEFIVKKYPQRVIIKSLNHYTIPGYDLLQGFDIYPGAFKPNRCISIYQAKNKKLEEFRNNGK